MRTLKKALLKEVSPRHTHIIVENFLKGEQKLYLIVSK